MNKRVVIMKICQSYQWESTLLRLTPAGVAMENEIEMATLG